MADILKSLGSSQEGVKRAAERAFRQTSDEIDRVDSDLLTLTQSLEVLVTVVAALDTRIAALESTATDHETRIDALETP